MPSNLTQYAFDLGFAFRKALVDAFSLAGHPIAFEEWTTLSRLQGDPGLTHKALAAKLDRDQTTITRMIDRLVAKGLAERRADPKDRRAARIFLTRAGYDAYQMMAPVADALQAKMVAAIPAEDLRKAEAVLGAALTAVNSLRKP